jgi:catechol 2,3-dioxygenase-like lactoylglutathione lyase family enzyme
MHDANGHALHAADRGTISRRQLLRALGVAAVGAPFASALGQGRCRLRLGDAACDTTAIRPVFEPTGWKTVLLDHFSMQVVDYEKEAAFFNALMGWKIRSDDGTRAVLDIGDFGSIVIRGGLQVAPATPSAAPAAGDSAGAGRGGRGAGRGGGRAPANAVMESFCFGIAPWNAKKVEAELARRGLAPVADNDGNGFESFHVKDPDGFDCQISNGNRKNRRTTPANGTLRVAAPFDSTGWKTVWLDHISFGVANYKESASFYCNLLGWKPTYDEGSQNECMIGDVGDIIIRGGNPLAPAPAAGDGRGGGAGTARHGRIDHISFGIAPWDTDKVKEALERRGLRARIDTSTGDEIHVAAYKSYHTTTPNGFDLQISAVHHDTRLTLPTAVRPRRANG